MSELMTHGSTLLNDAAVRLESVAPGGGRQLAGLLWRELGLPLLNDDPSEADTVRYLSAVERLARGEPLQYVTGLAGFRHLEVSVDPRVLIPRPETELLVELALDRVRTGRAIDVCTGSGAIALALASEGDFGSVLGLDISGPALHVARANGARLGIGVQWARSDMLGATADRSAELIVSNPPYLAEAEYQSLTPAVRDHEPSLALVSGDDGLNATRRLLDESRRVLVPGGWLTMELDSRRATDSAALATGLGWQAVSILDDLFGRARYLVARWEI